MNTTAQERFDFFCNATVQVLTEFMLLPSRIHTEEAAAGSPTALNSFAARGQKIARSERKENTVHTKSSEIMY